MAMVLTKLFKALRTSAREKSQGGVDLPILCYHQIGSEEVTKYPQIYLSKTGFEQHVQWLIRLGYKFLSLPDVNKLLQGEITPSEKYVVLTFDDGYEGIYVNAFPILQKYGCPATVFVIADKLTHHADITSFPFLTVAQLREMSNYGISLGSHSFYHTDLTLIRSDKDLHVEITDSKKAISDAIGVEVELFAYPLGHFNEKVANLVQSAGYSSACTIFEGRRQAKDELFRLKRLALAHQYKPMKFIYKLEVLSRVD